LHEIAASVFHAESLDAKLDGTRSCKTSAAVIGGFGKTVHNSRAASNRILRPTAPPDSPRFQWNKPSSGRDARSLAIAATAPADVVGLARWRDIVGSLAIATNDELPQHRLHCNNGIRDEQAERAAHNLSKGSDADGNTPRELAPAASQDTLKAGPREN